MYGKRIRELRKLHGLTMKELGQRLQLAESTISGYEHEIRKPDMDVLIRFAELFGVSVDYLLGLAESAQERPLPPLPDKAREAGAEYAAAILGVDGQLETLTEDEAKHLKTSLEMFRLWKAKQQKE